MRTAAYILVGLSAVAGAAAPAVRGAHTTSAPTLNLSSHHEEERPIDWRAIESASKHVDAARRDLARIGAEIRASIEGSVEFQDAISSAKQTRQDYLATVRSDQAQLDADNNYRALQWKVRQVEQKLDMIRDNPNHRDQPLLLAAKEAMLARRELTNAKAKLLSSDTSVTSAKEAMVDAARKLTDLRSSIQETILNDRAWLDAKDRYEAARKQLANVR